MKICESSCARQTSRRRNGFLIVLVLSAALGGKSNAQSGVSLAWAPPNGGGAAGYAIYQGGASHAYTQRIDVGTNTTVTMSGLAAGQTNYFAAVAYDSAGLESPVSNEATYTAPIVVAPNPPVTTNAPRFAPPPLAITKTAQLVISSPAMANYTCLLQGSTDLTNWTFIYTNQAGAALNYAMAIPHGETWEYFRTLSVTGGVSAKSLAQALSNGLFSANAVGYANVNAGQGYTLLANPFNAGNNSLTALIPTAPAGSVVFKYTSGSGYTSNVFTHGQWSGGTTTTLDPGDGGFLYNPSKTTLKLTFAGTVAQGTVTNFIPTGFSIASPMIPQADALATLPGTTGDQIHCYQGKWIAYTNVAGLWVGKPRTGPLTVNPGDAFFILKNAPADWVQTYWADE
jgi:hypothetical protein